MRRRRNADAPSDETPVSPTDITAADTNAPPPTDSVPLDSEAGTTMESAAPEAAPVAKPRRRTATSRRKTEEVVPEEPPVEAVTPPPAEPTESQPEKPKRAPRRRTPVKAVAEPEVVTEPVPEVVPETIEAPIVVPESIAVAEPEAVTVEPVPVTDDAEETANSEQEEVEAEATETTDAPGSSRRPRSRRRRGRRGNAAGEGTSENVTEGEPEGILPTQDVTIADQIAIAAPDTNAALAADGDDGGRGRRTRGLRRQSPGNRPAGETAETAATPAEPTAPQRIRGVRRQVVGRILGKPSAANVAAGATIEAPPTVVPGIAPVTTPIETGPPVYQPLPAETLARLAEAKVVVRNGVPELFVAGEPRLPFWFFVNTTTSEAEDAREIAVRQVRMAYEAGIRFFTTLTHLPWRTRSGERRYDVLDETIELIAANAPEAFILPRLIFSPPASWERTHPDEMTRYADGETGDISLASREFWEGEADDALRAAVEHVAQAPYASKVFGFYLEHGEWFYEKGRGYDYSEANRQGFRTWLRNRYRNAVVALRAGWNDGAVTFDTADVPSWPPPSGPTLFYATREQRYADYDEYASDIVAQVITRLGKSVKEASGGRSAVAVSYGYTLELPRSTSGHLALAQVLTSPYVDILTGPISYSARMPGGSAPLPVPVDSIHLAGKLWVSEDDTKTFRAGGGGETPDGYNPSVSSPEGTWAVHTRNFGAALARGAGISWMDLWGEGWLDDREIWQGIGHLRSIAEGVAARRRLSTTVEGPDVAVIIDERSFFGIRNDESLLGHLIADQRDCLLRSGARVGFYLLSDLLKKDFPTSPRLLLFLNAFRLPDSIRLALRDRYQDGGRTLAWVYGPGAAEENISELSDAVGMQLRLQPWGSKSGTQVLSTTRSPLTEGLRGQRLGDEKRINPSFYVVDPKAEVLGEYIGTGYPSVGVRRHGRWQSVFIGEQSLPLPLLRGLYRLAGVPVYTVDDDVAWISESLICLHSAPGGGTTVFLPEPGALVDLLNGEVLTSGGYGARLSMPPRGTRLLFHGTVEEIARFGIDTRSAPLGLEERELPPIPPPFVMGESGASSSALSDISPEDEALLAAVLSGDTSLPNKDAEDEEEDEDEDIVEPIQVSTTIVAPDTTDPADASGAGKKKRRRRRRGRSRRADEEDGDMDAASSDDSIGEDDSDEDDDDEPEAIALVISAVPPVSVPRERPSLEELLPMSESPTDGDLPPIPDEFLPLDPSALTEPTESEEEGGSTRRRRTRAPRRRRPLSDTEGNGEAAP